jgi:hypothetical protein
MFAIRKLTVSWTKLKTGMFAVVEMEKSVMATSTAHTQMFNYARRVEQILNVFVTLNMVITHVFARYDYI